MSLVGVAEPPIMSSRLGDRVGDVCVAYEARGGEALVRNSSISEAD